MEAIREEVHRKCGITVYVDENPVGPREWDNLGEMVCWHSNYNLGDKQPDHSTTDWLHNLALEHTDYLEADVHSEHFSNLENMTKEQMCLFAA